MSCGVALQIVLLSVVAPKVLPYNADSAILLSAQQGYCIPNRHRNI
jgi:hypothetical protein